MIWNSMSISSLIHDKNGHSWKKFWKGFFTVSFFCGDGGSLDYFQNGYKNVSCLINQQNRNNLFTLQLIHFTKIFFSIWYFNDWFNTLVLNNVCKKKKKKKKKPFIPLNTILIGKWTIPTLLDLQNGKKWQNWALCGHPLPCLKGLTPKQVHQGMEATLGKDTPLYSMVKKWAGEFKHSRESLEDDPRPGRLHNARFGPFFHI